MSLADRYLDTLRFATRASILCTRVTPTQMNRQTIYTPQVEPGLSQPWHDALSIRPCGQRFPFSTAYMFLPSILEILCGHRPKIHVMPHAQELDKRTEPIATTTSHSHPWARNPLGREQWDGAGLWWNDSFSANTSRRKLDPNTIADRTDLYRHAQINLKIDRLPR